MANHEVNVFVYRDRIAFRGRLPHYDRVAERSGRVKGRDGAVGCVDVKKIRIFENHDPGRELGGWFYGRRLHEEVAHTLEMENGFTRLLLVAGCVHLEMRRG